MFSDEDLIAAPEAGLLSQKAKLARARRFKSTIQAAAIMASPNHRETCRLSAKSEMSARASKTARSMDMNHSAIAATFWGGLGLHEASSEWRAFFYCLINAGLIFFAVFIDRRIYAIFGALGIAIYLGHLAYDVFKDALLFSFALSAIGLLIIGLGVAFHRKREAIDHWIDGKLPKSLRALRPLAWKG